MMGKTYTGKGKIEILVPLYTSTKLWLFSVAFVAMEMLVLPVVLMVIGLLSPVEYIITVLI